MPVTIVPSDHGANSVPGWFASSALQVLHEACPYTKELPLEIMQSSLNLTMQSSTLTPSKNGLVFSMIQAYSSHNHLCVRPEDVWFTILTQFVFFIVAHAEDMRSLFVTHQGQKELTVKNFDGDFANFALEIGRLIQENVVDPELRSWVMPDFSTSTSQDEMVASIIMMGTVQKYFTSSAEIVCGILSVTLLGNKADWEKLLRKVDKLDEFGDEPRLFAKLLRPILRRFVQSFKDPTGRGVIEFWQRVLDVNSGSDFTLYSGWMTAFCFWDEDGKLMYKVEDDVEYSENAEFGQKVETLESNGQMRTLGRHIPLYLSLDGVRYHHIEHDKISPGWTKVPIKIYDDFNIVEAEMVAGSIGIHASSSGALDSDGKEQLDTIQPESGWWVFRKNEVKHDEL